MTTMEILGFSADGSDPKEPADMIMDLVQKMRERAAEEQRAALIRCESQHEIGYRKGKAQALDEVLEMLRTGKIP